MKGSPATTVAGTQEKS